MRGLLATFCKDLLVLWRDRAGLAVLFLMPLALVIVVSLVQNNIMQLTGDSATKLVLVDQDGGFVGQGLSRFLAEQPEVSLEIGNDAEDARKAVAAGDYQCGLIIPPGTSEELAQRLQKQTAEEWSDDASAAVEVAELPIEIVFDGTIQGLLRFALTTSVRYALFGLETIQREHITMQMVFSELDMPKEQAILRESVPEPLLVVTEGTAGGQALRPNSVQQNVPAWSLFGMFFIAVPLAGALIRERQEGTLKRIICAPAAVWQVLIGKTLAYSLIGLLQFGLMILVGRYLLPHLGTPVFDVGDQPLAVFVLALAASLAATGFGMLLGVLVRSYDQASMAGAVAIVIAAALGGIMVPVFAMPGPLQTLSRISPLNWGLDGFYELFVRGGGLGDISSNLVALLAFFGVTLLAAISIFSFRSRYGQ